MSASVNLHEALRRLDLLGETVKTAVREEAAVVAERMAADLRTQYPRVTGNLIKGVRVQHGARGSYVLTHAPHAHLYEWGTRVRKNYTRRGANRGRMPAANVFVPAAVSRRELYIERLTRLVDGADIEL